MTHHPASGHHHDDPTVSRGALVSAALLLVFSLALTATVSFGWVAQSANPDASRMAAHVTAQQSRMLTFTDQPSGAVLIRDAQSGAMVSTIAYGQGGFVRATMRRLVKARRAAGYMAPSPFELVRWSNGALSIRDPQTGESAEIHGFGGDHSRAFAEMLPAPAV
jgi:putative photosynthetic complex assembly protein